MKVRGSRAGVGVGECLVCVGFRPGPRVVEVQAIVGRVLFQVQVLVLGWSCSLEAQSLVGNVLFLAGRVLGSRGPVHSWGRPWGEGGQLLSGVSGACWVGWAFCVGRPGAGGMVGGCGRGRAAGDRRRSAA